jgi:hypothetical protein
MAEMFYLRDNERNLLPMETDSFVDQATVSKAFLMSIANDLRQSLCLKYDAQPYKIDQKTWLQYNAYQNIETTIPRENYIEEHEDGVLFTIAISNSSGLFYKNSSEQSVSVDNK